MNNNILVILDNVRSVYNVGSIMRSLDCVGCNKIYLCGITAQPKIIPGIQSLKKTALAAYENLDWQYFKNTEDAIKKAKIEGYKIYIIEQSNTAVNLSIFNLEFPAAFVFGHEVDGVNEKLFKLADEILQLPNSGSSKSWNVSSTAAIVIYEAWKQLK